MSGCQACFDKTREVTSKISRGSAVQDVEVHLLVSGCQACYDETREVTSKISGGLAVQ